MTFILLKVGCAVIYVLALAGAVGLLPVRLATKMEVATIALPAVHGLELIFLFGKLPLYRGSLAVSILPTVLFGLLHWKPSAEAHAT